MRLLAGSCRRYRSLLPLKTGFHQTIEDRNKYYPIPFEWADKFPRETLGIPWREPSLHLPPYRGIAWSLDLRIISCHLGGSNSLCAIRNGQSVLTSMGMSPQSGLPHNNRVGDFDPFAIPVLMQATGKSLGDLTRYAGGKKVAC